MEWRRRFAVGYAIGCAVAFRLLIPTYMDCVDETVSCACVRKMMAFYKLSPLLVAGAVMM
jgi:hypothetical protein